jgi:glycosyltransferase involved in cell wall biosynthesis
MVKDRQGIYLNHRSSIEEDEPKRTLAAIPCYNEAKTIGSVVLKAKQYVDEVVVIDDGCTDDTVNVATIAGATVLRHGGNKGYGAAIQSCFQYARDHGFDVMTILDGDGQHDADQIQTVMQPVLAENVDISIGSRFVDGNGHNVPRYRRFGIGVLTGLTNAGSPDDSYRLTDGQSGFRTYSRRAIAMLDPKDCDMGVSAEILLQGRKQNLLFKETPITVDYEGECSTKKPVGHGLGVIISILKYMEVEHALLFFGVPGMIMFTLGLALGFTVYMNYLQTQVLALGNALITIAFLVLGVLCGMTGLILHAVINAKQRR